MKKLNCSITGDEFFVADGEEKLISDFGLPLPSIAPFERWLKFCSRAMPFAFYRTTCPVTKQNILTRWGKNGAIIGVSSNWFWSDACDNTSAGQEFDFSRPFFEQFVEVARKSYAPSLNVINCEESPYVNASIGLRRCHLCFACEELENCIYCCLCYHSSDLLLCVGVKNSELAYACIDCERIYDSRFLQDCENCSSCYWCIDCIGCTNCYACAGLRQAKDGYYIFNEKVNKKTWDETIGTLNLGSYQAEQHLSQTAEAFLNDKQNYNSNHNTENCHSINHVKNSKNTDNSTYSSDCEDCKDVIFANKSRNCYSCMWVHNSERCYMVIGALNAYDCYFSDGSVNSKNHIYSICCFNGCEHLLGCFFLKRKDYCILNKQYSKEEYFKLLPRVIEHMKSTGEWGQWFPSELYGDVVYKNSWGHFFFSNLSDKEIIKRDLLLEINDDTRVIESGTILPDDVHDFGPELCDKEIQCEETRKPYGIGKKDLAAFKKHLAPIPRRHWSAMLTKMQRKSMSQATKHLL